METSRTTELLAPAGSFETARAAFAAGADAVYLGLDAFSARAEAVNFSEADLKSLLALARPAGKKVYVAFNTLVRDDELPRAVETLALLDDLRPDGLIVQDLGVARLARRHFPALALHASTQLAAHNLEGVLALKDLGFTRVVLARELSIADIRTIAARCGVEIETFVHGALCYSISGLCLFSALERDRSGNRGRCAYCCRLPYTDAAGRTGHPFSMRDLRLDDRLPALVAAGVASLKIEGRMKSALYVASVTRRYRDLLDGVPPTVSRADLETVFSRRTTRLYADGAPDGDLIDPVSLGHVGTPVGTVKRLTKDREGRAWLRFHTARALEKHDGLQFAAPGGGRPVGFGISDMRLALSRRPVFTAPAGSDVEIRLPTPDAYDRATPDAAAFAAGATVYCSASNAVKRRFPVPPFRPSDAPGGTAADIALALAPDGVSATAAVAGLPPVTARIAAPLAAAQNPDRTFAAAEKAFARTGGTDWALGRLTLDDPARLFAPASVLNDLRRDLLARLDAARRTARAAKVAAVLAGLAGQSPAKPARTLKLRLDQALPDDAAAYDEIIFAIGHGRGAAIEAALTARCAELRACAEAAGESAPAVRLALPVFTLETDYAALRAAVKHLANKGMRRWEAADLAALRLLRALGFADVTADWTLYAANAAARAALADLGAVRHVASPEDPAPPADDERLVRQHTPLFLSLTTPAASDPSRLAAPNGDRFRAGRVDNLWVTTRADPRTASGACAIARTDLSWDAPAQA